MVSSPKYEFQSIPAIPQQGTVLGSDTFNREQGIKPLGLIERNVDPNASDEAQMNSARVKELTQEIDESRRKAWVSARKVSKTVQDMFELDAVAKEKLADDWKVPDKPGWFAPHMQWAEYNARKEVKDRFLAEAKEARAKISQRKGVDLPPAPEGVSEKAI